MSDISLPGWHYFSSLFYNGGIQFEVLLQSIAYAKRILLGRQTGVPCYPKLPARFWTGGAEDDKNKSTYDHLASTHFFSHSANLHDTPNLFGSQVRYKAILTYVPFLLPVVAVNTQFRQKTIRNALILMCM